MCVFAWVCVVTVSGKCDLALAFIHRITGYTIIVCQCFPDSDNTSTGTLYGQK